MKLTKIHAERKNFAFASRYFDKDLVFTPENNNYTQINLPGYYCISPAANQILKHLNSQYIEEYYS